MVSNREKSKGNNVTSIPFSLLSPKARQADTFKEFLTSLMSVGKTANDGKISIFTNVVSVSSGVVRYHDNTGILYCLYFVLWAEFYVLCFVNVF